MQTEMIYDLVHCMRLFSKDALVVRKENPRSSLWSVSDISCLPLLGDFDKIPCSAYKNLNWLSPVRHPESCADPSGYNKDKELPTRQRRFIKFLHYTYLSKPKHLIWWSIDETTKKKNLHLPWAYITHHGIQKRRREIKLGLNDHSRHINLPENNHRPLPVI